MESGGRARRFFVLLDGLKRAGRQLLVEEPLDFFRRRRPAEEIALAVAAADLAGDVRLRGMLDSLGDGAEAERVAEPQDRVDEALSTSSPTSRSTNGFGIFSDSIGNSASRLSDE